MNIDDQPLQKANPSLAGRPGSGRPPTKVIYISGYGRSGTTLLDIGLGMHPDVFGGGELTTIARHVWANGEYCACGQPAPECEIWGPAMRQWLSGEPAIDISRHAARQVGAEQIASGFRLFGLFGSEPGRDHAKENEALFSRICDVTATSVVVDSSKLPGRGIALARLPGIDLYVIHVVRDGRGVAWSLMKPHKRKIEDGIQRDLKPKPLIYVALRWLIVNLATEYLRRKVGPDRSLCVRYEDFVHQPRQTLEKIWHLVGLDPAQAAFHDNDPLEPAHQVAGSRHRMKKSIVMRLDEGWKSAMPKWKQALFTLVTYPLLARYGYKISGTASGKAKEAMADATGKLHDN